MSTVRRLSSWIHLYGGLALGGLLIVVSVTGSALVFKDTLDRWLRPDLLRVEPTGERVSLDRMVSAVRSAHPEATLRLVEMPDHATAPVTVWLAADNTHVYVDPYRGTVLGTRGPQEGIMNTLSALHVEVLAGRAGMTVVGVLGLLLVLLTATGLVLWWPRRVQALWTALRISWKHGTLRFNYDLHRAGGFYTTVFLLLTALTGSAFVFYPTTKHVVSTLTASEPWPPEPPTVEARPDTIRPGPSVSYEAALQAAQEQLPGAEVSFVYGPQSETGPLTVRLRTPPELHPKGRSFVYVHPTEATALRVDDARTAPGGAQLLQALYPLHVGAVGGRVGKWLYVLLGLAPAVLSVTGTIIWYRRWRRAAPDPPDRDEVGTRSATLPPRLTADEEGSAASVVAQSGDDVYERRSD